MTWHADRSTQLINLVAGWNTPALTHPELSKNRGGVFTTDATAQFYDLRLSGGPDHTNITTSYEHGIESGLATGTEGVRLVCPLDALGQIDIYTGAAHTVALTLEGAFDITPHSDLAHNGVQALSWQYLDLSAWIGASKQLVLLEITNTDANNLQFYARPADLIDVPDDESYNPAGPLSPWGAVLGPGHAAYILVPTDSTGRIQTQVDNSGLTFSVTILGTVDDYIDSGDVLYSGIPTTTAYQGLHSGITTDLFAVLYHQTQSGANAYMGAREHAEATSYLTAGLAGAGRAYSSGSCEAGGLYAATNANGDFDYESDNTVAGQLLTMLGYVRHDDPPVVTPDVPSAGTVAPRRPLIRARIDEDVDLNSSSVNLYVVQGTVTEHIITGGVLQAGWNGAVSREGATLWLAGGTPDHDLARGAWTAYADATDTAGQYGSTSWSFTVADEPVVVTTEDGAVEELRDHDLSFQIVDDASYAPDPSTLVVGLTPSVGPTLYAIIGGSFVSGFDGNISVSGNTMQVVIDTLPPIVPGVMLWMVSVDCDSTSGLSL